MKAGGGLYYDRYSVNGRDEWLMRIGEAEAPPILFLSPLLEEMNRTRALLAGIMRAVAARGFGCWLPDLPGTGESERALEDCDWTDWRDAARAAGHYAARTSGKPLGHAMGTHPRLAAAGYEQNAGISARCVQAGAQNGALAREAQQATHWAAHSAISAASASHSSDEVSGSERRHRAGPSSLRSASRGSLARRNVRSF